MSQLCFIHSNTMALPSGCQACSRFREGLKIGREEMFKEMLHEIKNASDEQGFIYTEDLEDLFKIRFSKDIEEEDQIDLGRGWKKP